MNFKDAIAELFRNHDSYSRLPRLLEMQQNEELRPKTFYRLLGEIWTACDNIGPCSEILSDIIYDTRLDFATPDTCHIPVMMSRKEQKALAALPTKVEIYRGCGPLNKQGYSWTLNREVAERFPRYMRFYQREPLLLTATIERNMITALKMDRKEDEVILFILPNDDEIREEALPIAA